MIKPISLLIVFLVGLVVPFQAELVVIEFFNFLIPIGIILSLTSIYLIVSIFDKRLSNKYSLYIFAIFFVFISSQLLSGFVVDKIQRSRSDIIIKELQLIEAETGKLPNHYDVPLGIEYRKSKLGFILSYSRGFMVMETYDSVHNRWDSFGWPD